MLSIIAAIAILVPVFGALLYAMFSAKSQPKTRLTPFGEVPLTELDERDRGLV
jgi:heme/copper-type cytochrome/quinol oxidase subunit 2